MRRLMTSREGLFDKTESSLLGGVSNMSAARDLRRRIAGETTPTGLTFPKRGSSSDDCGASFRGVTSMIESSAKTWLVYPSIVSKELWRLTTTEDRCVPECT